MLRPPLSFERYGGQLGENSVTAADVGKRDSAYRNSYRGSSGVNSDTRHFSSVASTRNFGGC
jgi:hypothetical protein